MEIGTLIQVDHEKQNQPYFYYQELIVSQYREYITFSPPNGFGYLLKRITMNYNTSTARAGSLYHNNPMLSVEFFDTIGTIARQSNPIAFNLISTPAGTVDTSPVLPLVAPVPLKGYRHFHKTLNYYWSNKDAVQLQITGQGFNDISNMHGLQLDLQILLEGIFIYIDNPEGE